MADTPDLAGLILEKTQEGKLTWERLSSGAFATIIGRSNIVVDQTKNSNIMMRITNEDGLVVETLSSHDRLDQTLEELYELARRRALRVDEVLSEIKQSLDRL
jgi:hypothetical protein